MLGRREENWEETRAEQVESAVRRICEFLDLGPDDLARSVIARNKVRHYLAVDLTIQRRSEILGLEAQWNPLGRG